MSLYSDIIKYTQIVFHCESWLPEPWFVVARQEVDVKIKPTGYRAVNPVLDPPPLVFQGRSDSVFRIWHKLRQFENHELAKGNFITMRIPNEWNSGSVHCTDMAHQDRGGQEGQEGQKQSDTEDLDHAHTTPFVKLRPPSPLEYIPGYDLLHNPAVEGEEPMNSQLDLGDSHVLTDGDTGIPAEQSWRACKDWQQHLKPAFVESLQLLRISLTIQTLLSAKMKAAKQNGSLEHRGVPDAWTTHHHYKQIARLLPRAKG
ncbi:hypothetical protein K438DRAFT_1750047 [Mycena galopus ATCC 62051]|nr:hypothetical protein K438DRAFT_1750047 [Mycena galopus ATCC 62051]